MRARQAFSGLLIAIARLNGLNTCLRMHRLKNTPLLVGKMKVLVPLGSVIGRDAVESFDPGG